MIFFLMDVINVFKYEVKINEGSIDVPHLSI
jgi:hypothetical protein